MRDLIFVDQAHFAKGLFVYTRRREKSGAEVYWEGGDTRVRFDCPRRLGALEQSVLFGALALADSVDKRCAAGGSGPVRFELIEKIGAALSVSDVGAALIEGLNIQATEEGQAVDRPQLTIASVHAPVSMFIEAVGYKDTNSGVARKNLEAAFRALADVRLTIMRRDRPADRSTQLLSFIQSREGRTISVAFNHRLSHHLLEPEERKGKPGRKQLSVPLPHTIISLFERLQFSTHETKLIHAWLSANTAPGRHLTHGQGVKLSTLVDNLWGKQARATSSLGRREAMVIEALSEINQTSRALSEHAKGHGHRCDAWDITYSGILNDPLITARRPKAVIRAKWVPATIPRNAADLMAMPRWNLWFSIADLVKSREARDLPIGHPAAHHGYPADNHHENRVYNY